MTVHECYDFGSDGVLRFWRGNWRTLAFEVSY